MDEILVAETPELLREVRGLFKEYVSLLGIDLTFQDFANEIATLPGDYASPTGVLLVAHVAGRAAGCVGVRRFGEGVSEMKRLFVRHPFRGQGVGRRLVVASIEHARGLGYRLMRLDTLPWMREALSIYRSLGFQEVAPYRVNPVVGAAFMEREL